MKPKIEPYWPVRGQLTVEEDLLHCGGRIIVRVLLQAETLHKLHDGHQGIQRCQLRAQSSIWWPGISQQIADFVNHCSECCRDTRPQREPLLTFTLPDYPWQKAATDLFDLKGATYLVVVDYFSRYPEGHTTTDHHIKESHQRFEVNLCPSWHSRGISQ